MQESKPEWTGVSPDMCPHFLPPLTGLGTGSSVKPNMALIFNSASFVSPNDSSHSSKYEPFTSKRFLPTWIFFVDAVDKEVGKVKQMINQFATPVLQSPISVMVLFVLAVYSYYVKKDLILFLLLLITFLARRQ